VRSGFRCCMPNGRKNGTIPGPVQAIAGAVRGLRVLGSARWAMTSRRIGKAASPPPDYPRSPMRRFRRLELEAEPEQLLAGWSVSSASLVFVPKRPTWGSSRWNQAKATDRAPCWRAWREGGPLRIPCSGGGAGGNGAAKLECAVCARAGQAPPATLASVRVVGEICLRGGTGTTYQDQITPLAWPHADPSPLAAWKSGGNFATTGDPRPASGGGGGERGWPGSTFVYD